jgi:integrase/recombinase XerD
MSRNLYRRDAIWWGRAQVAGTEHRRSLRTRDRTEAGKRLKAWKAELERAAHFGIERHSWQEAVTRYVQEIVPDAVKASTAARYLTSLRMVDPILAPLHLDQITRTTMAQIAGRKGPTNATKRRDLTAISQVLRAAGSWGWVDRNVALDYDRGLIRERRDPIRLPTDQDINALVAACPNAMLRGLVQTLRGTGVRLEEAASLERRQIDFSRKAITLERTKRGTARTIPMSAQVAGTLQALPVRLGCPYVFWHGEGERYHNLSSGLAAIGKRAGVQFRRHDLRHRFAVDYLRDGGSIYDLQQILGHASIKTTEIYLAFLTPGEQRVAKRLGANADGT